MENVLAEYYRWKQQGDSLRTQAKQAMEARFRDLLTEAARIAHEYQRDFGGALKPPAPITAFRYKPLGVKASKKSAPPVTKAAPKPDPKTIALEKRLAQAKAKRDAAKAAGKPVKNLEDRIYEIEDEIRLSAQV